MLPRKQRVQTGKAILAAMLHNLGHLALASLFPKEFSDLNSALSDNNSETSITDLEQRMFGITHCEIGHWLAEFWNMPSEVCTAIKQHHDLEYDGPYKEYAYLVQLADILLAQHNIGDASDDELPEKLLQDLGISKQQVNAVFEKTIKDREDLDNMARQLAA